MDGDEIEKEQQVAMSEAEMKCYQEMNQQPYPNTTDGRLYCNRTWDDIMCWPDVPAGETAYRECPAYVHDFQENEFATRQCMPDGSWYMHPRYNKTWTNYTACTSQSPRRPSLFENHMHRLQPVYHVGYGISVIALLVAIFVMVFFRKLRCPRNTLHINLFISFILRAVVCFLRDWLMVYGIGLPLDIEVDTDGSVIFRQDISHWECRLLFTCICYANVANYAWIFVEGLYLHTLIFLSVFSENSAVTWYIIAGWVSPVIVILPWIIVRVTLENTWCWNTHQTPGYLHIIKAPIAATILLNFAFFLNIMRVLYIKMQSSDLPLQDWQCRNRKLAKSTLILIPMFGVPYVVFLAMVDDKLSEAVQVVKLYFEMTFNSFNGLLVACVLCFFNGEVQAEVTKRWRRWRHAGRSTPSSNHFVTSRSITNVSIEMHRVASSTAAVADVGTGMTHQSANATAADDRRTVKTTSSWLDCIRLRRNVTAAKGSHAVMNSPSNSSIASNVLRMKQGPSPASSSSPKHVCFSANGDGDALMTSTVQGQTSGLDGSGRTCSLAEEAAPMTGVKPERFDNSSMVSAERRHLLTSRTRTDGNERYGDFARNGVSGVTLSSTATVPVGSPTSPPSYEEVLRGGDAED